PIPKRSPIAQGYRLLAGTAAQGERAAAGVALTLPRRQFLAVGGVRGGNIDAYCLERRAAGVPDLVRLALLDEQQGSWNEWHALPIHGRAAAAGNHLQPLVRATMPVVIAPFTLARRQCHLRSLRAAIAEGDVKTLAEAELLMVHAQL